MSEYELALIIASPHALIIAIPIIIYSIIIHEISHGYAAYLLGDPTAKNLGRLSLNPIKHIDPFGTILLPAMTFFTMGILFGYAKPVPINTRYFKNSEQGMFLTAAAGPVSNIIIGLIFGLIAKLGMVSGLALAVVFWVIILNFILAFFNLIPIPPLDGSRVLSYFLPPRLKYKYYELERVGMLLLLLLLFFGAGLVFRVFSVVLVPVMNLFGFSPDLMKLLGY